MNKVMTLEEVAAFLKVHPSTVYRLLRQHKIPAFKLGSDWRFNLESIERWVAERETACSESPSGRKIAELVSKKQKPTSKLVELMRGGD